MCLTTEAREKGDKMKRKSCEKKRHYTLYTIFKVGANKKFTFRFHSTVVLQCNHSSKNGMKFLLRKRSTHRLYGFQTVKVLERLQQLRPISNAVQPVICFRPRVSLYDNPCPVFVAFR